MATTVEKIIMEYIGDTSDLKSKSKEAEAAIDSVEKKAKRAGGGITSSLKNIEIGVIVQAVTELAEISFKVGKAIGTWWQEDRREAFLNDLERMKELNKDIQENQSRQHQEVFTELKMIEDPEKQFKFLDEQTEKARRNLGGLKFQFNRIKQNAEDMEPTWLSLWQAGKEGAEISKEQLKDVNQQLEAQREHLEDLARKRGELIEQQKREAEQLLKENVKAVEEVTKRYQMQIDTFGMTARQAELYAHAQKEGTEEALKLARALDQQLTKLEEEARLKKAAEREQEAYDRKVTNMKNRLKEQIIEMKKGEQAALAFRLAQEGITGQDAKEILALNKKNMILEKQKELREELKQKIKDYNRALEDSNKTTDALAGDRNFDISAVGITSDVAELRAKESGGEEGGRGGMARGAKGILQNINTGIQQLIRATLAKEAFEVNQIEKAEV